MMDQKMFMTLNSKFVGIRVIDGMMIPVEWKVEANFRATTPDEDGTRTAVTYQKMLFWVSELLDSVIIVNIDSDMGLYLNAATGNNIMTVPGEPVDALICKVLISKLRAIGAEADLEIMTLSLTGNDLNLTYHYADPDSEMDLPATCIVEGIETQKTPWWNKATSEINDYVDEIEEHVEEKSNIVEMKVPDVDILVQFGEQIAKNLSLNVAAKSKTIEDKEATIIEPEWEKKK